MNTAIVTGASQGFGQATASALTDRGWTVVIDARDPTELSRAAEAIGPGAIPVPGDVTDPDHVAELITTATRAGNLRLLVNNASTLGPSPQPGLATYPIDALRHVYETNVLAPLRLVQVALPHLRETGGTVVNITSDAAVEPYETWGGYGSSKSALEQVSNILAAEEPSVHVYWFDPGDMRTRMHQEAFPGEDISDRPLPETRVPGLIRLVEGNHPSGRYAAADFLEGAR